MTLAVWFVSGWAYLAWIRHERYKSVVSVSLGGGCISWEWHRPLGLSGKVEFVGWDGGASYGWPTWVLGFDIGSESSGPFKRSWAVIPLWSVLLVFAASTGYIWRLDRRRPPGLCPACGYSLSGLPPGGACPECGKGVAA